MKVTSSTGTSKICVKPAHGCTPPTLWPSRSLGKAIRITAQLLPWLPPEFDYRFVIISRYLEEILASQRNKL